MTIDGWLVPFVEPVSLSGGRTRLVLDNRFGLVLDEDKARYVLPWIANAIAVASGFSCHPRSDHDQPKSLSPYRRVHYIDPPDVGQEGQEQGMWSRLSVVESSAFVRSTSSEHADEHRS